MTRLRSILRAFAFLSFVLLSLLLLCQTSEAKDCFGSLRKPLEAGGYSGSMNCDEVRINFKKIGSISIGGKTYVLFDLQRRTIPDFPGAQVKGENSILVFNTNIFLGRYILFAIEPERKIVVTKTSIKSVPALGNGIEIVFTEDGPPLNAVFDGDLVEFHP